MNFFEIISLFGIMAALAAIPSASVALVVTRSVTLGIANGIAVAVGIVLGDLLFILLAIFGLSVVAETMGNLFMVIKYIGAIYLLWLGCSLLMCENKVEIAIKNPIKKRNLIASFLAGFMLTLGDIKAIIFYVSLFPIFIDLSALRVADVMIISSVMIVSVGGVKVAYAVSATKIAALAEKYMFDNSIRKTTGGIMIGAGSYLMVKA